MASVNINEVPPLFPDRPQISIAPTGSAPAPEGGDAQTNGFCGAEARVSTQICNSLHPAVAFDGSGNANVVWHDSRDGNFEVYTKLIGSRLDQSQIKLNQGLAFDPATGKAYNLSCSAFSGGSSEGVSNVLITQSGGRLDVNTASRTMVLTAGTGSIDFQTAGVLAGSGVSIINGLNAGKRFFVSRLLAPTVAELNFIDRAQADTGFVYSISKAGTSLNSDEVRLTCGRSSSLFPDVIADSSGRFHVVYQNNRDGHFELYYVQMYPKSVGKAKCTGANQPVSASNFGPVPPGTEGSATITSRPINPATGKPNPAAQGTTVSFSTTGSSNAFFSFGNKLLPDPIPAIDGPIPDRKGQHRLFKDFVTGSGEYTGVSKAADRATWAAQALAAGITVLPDYVAPVSHPIAAEGDFGTKFSFKDVAFLSQTPPDKSVEITQISLPLRPKCLPSMPATVGEPDFADLVSAPKKPVPPGFQDPVDLSTILSSPLASIDDSTPARFTVEGDSSGTVFTNILTDNGRGQLSRFVFNCSSDHKPKEPPRFILGQRRCGTELCALQVNSKDGPPTPPPNAQYKITLQVWQGPDYRFLADQDESARIENCTKIFEKEFFFDPSDSIVSFNLKRGELKVDDGRMLFFVPIPGEGVEFFIEGVGGGHAVWSTDEDGAFAQYYVPFTVQPNAGLTVPVYYEGFLHDATSTVVIGPTANPPNQTDDGGSSQNNLSPFAIDLGLIGFTPAEIGDVFESSTPAPTSSGIGFIVHLPDGVLRNDANATRKLSRIHLGVTSAGNKISITRVKNSSTNPSYEIPDESAVIYTETFQNAGSQREFLTNVDVPETFAVLIQAAGGETKANVYNSATIPADIAATMSTYDISPIQNRTGNEWLPIETDIIKSALFFDRDISTNAGGGVVGGNAGGAVGGPAGGGGAGDISSIIADIPIKLTKGNGDSVHPRFGIDSQDNIWVVFHSNRTGTNEVYAGRYICGKWTTSALGGTDIKLTNAAANGKSASFPNVAIDDIGDAHVVWQSDDTEDGESDIYYAKTSGGQKTFSAPTRISASPGEALMPDIAISSGSAGSSTSSCAGSSAGTAGGSGRITVVWHDSRFGNQEIVSAFKESGEWQGSGQGSTDTRITQAAGESLFPRIAADHHGNLRVVYHDRRRGRDNPWIFMSTFIAADGKWDSTAQGGSDLPITPNGTDDSLHPDIAIDPVDGVFVVWHDGRFKKEGPNQQEEIMCSYCPRSDSAVKYCGPICTNIEAFISTQVDIIDCVQGKPIDVTNVPEVCISILSPGATFFRISEDGGDYSEWIPFTPGAMMDTTIMPWVLGPGSGKKNLCIQVQDATTVGFPVCKDIILQAGVPAFKIEFFKDVDLTMPLDMFNNHPVAPAGDIFIKLTSSASLLTAPTFDVISRGVRLAFNQQTTALSGASGFSDSAGAGSFAGALTSTAEGTGFSAFGSTTFKGRFTVRRDDGFLHADGLARIIPHGKSARGEVF